MKLYTEQQVIEMIEKSRQTGLTAEYLILTTTPIELPTDEQIGEGRDEHINAPTIAEVVMWLYEEHGIWIYAHRIDQKEFYWSIDTDKKEFTSGENFKTPTEAYEAAIEYTLKNLL